MARGEVPYEKPGVPKGEAHGVAAVTQALEGIDFPASKRDLGSKAGNRSIEYYKGESVRLRDVLEAMPDYEYTSMAAVAAAMREALERGAGRSIEQSRR